MSQVSTSIIIYAPYTLHKAPTIGRHCRPVCQGADRRLTMSGTCRTTRSIRTSIICKSETIKNIRYYIICLFYDNEYNCVTCLCRWQCWSLFLHYLVRRQCRFLCQGCRHCWPIYIHTEPSKRDILFLTITLANLRRFFIIFISF